MFALPLARSPWAPTHMHPRSTEPEKRRNHGQSFFFKKNVQHLRACLYVLHSINKIAFCRILALSLFYMTTIKFRTVRL
jgi:hypothetical protein